MIHRLKDVSLKPVPLLSLVFCVVTFLWLAVLPFSRAFRLAEINYNEGWNVYNAERVANHQPLYATANGWTSVNYPALSFHLVAAFGRYTTNYLFTARILSLTGLCLSGILAGLIVWHTTRSRFAAWLSGLYLVAMFCANATGYVGMDDPQILAQAFFLGGVYVYLRGDRRGWALDLTALLFVLGGNIKHNLIEFPLAVLLDLLCTSPRRALRYASGGALMAAISVVLTSKTDGAAYVSCLLAPRGYALSSAISQVFIVLLPILLPTVAALWMANYCWNNPQQRVLALLLLCALAVDAYFSGGSGVSINGMFGSMLAIGLLTGVFWAEFSKLPLGRFKVLPPAVVCVLFFLWLAVPMVIFRNWRTEDALKRSSDKEQRFAAEVAYLRQQPGPALCESLLSCYYAGKPYLYDPYNSTRLIEQGRLDANVIVDHLRKEEYGAVQLSEEMEQKPYSAVLQQRFAPPILEAIQQYYRSGFKDKDGVIYLPKSQAEQTRPNLSPGH